MSEASVVLYGASGYTGKHVAWKLAEKGIPFIAAGRNKERLAKQLGEMPELAEADYEVVAVDHDEAALTTLFEGKKVVHNLVGPYMQLGEPVVRAALNAGVHYLDATGEQDWMLHVRELYGPQLRAEGAGALPACASMWNSGMMAAEFVLERAGIDSLDIVYTLARRAVGLLDAVVHADVLPAATPPLRERASSPGRPATGHQRLGPRSP